MTEYPKKLIEVALPLDDINVAAAREKSIRHGHPSTLHLWWARRPLAVARAVLFAQLVNDPGGKRGYGKYKGQTKEDAQKERERLFDIIRDLVKWENINNEEVLERARAEIKKSWRETCEITGDDPYKMPPFLDPFAGGGAIPLEAQRLGLESHASDLNPVAVMINKAMIEIPPKFSGKTPVGPEVRGLKQKKTYKPNWSGARGVAEDVRRYGYWMREEAFKRIGSLYPKVEITQEMTKTRDDLKGLEGKKLTVIAWLWTRTVKCPSPACGCEMPLLSSFVLSSKKGKQAYLVPRFDDELTFDVSLQPPTNLGDIKKGFKRGISGIFECINCGTVTTRNYTAEQAVNVGLGAFQTAVVCEGVRGRIYLPAKYARIPRNIPKVDKAGLLAELSPNPRDVWCRNFGLNTPADLFTSRQLVALTTFSNLVQEARNKVVEDAQRAGWVDDGIGLDDGGNSSSAYGDAVAVYLAFAVNKMADRGSTICSWDSSRSSTRNTFGRQAIPMTWDYAESNPFSTSTGNFTSGINWAVKVLDKVLGSGRHGFAIQNDAAQNVQKKDVIFSTDPPYYDNIGYADLSDFFYVWLRRSLKSIYPDIFSTMLVPKEPELVATPYRHGSKTKAETFFLDGMTRAIHNMAVNAHSAFPVTIYYAFKQSETKAKGTVSTGWETFLEAVKKAGFGITGTWPMRTELSNRLVGSGTNALASSIVLVCRKLSDDVSTISRKQYLRELNDTLPDALEEMIGGTEGISPIAPVDLAQAAIGPGMAVFSQYEAVLEADGSPMSVRNGLILINKTIDEYFSQAESDMDSDTRFCVDWFLQYGFIAAQFGEADVLARAKGTTVDGIKQAGVVESGAGKVRLLRKDEYPENWDPTTDKRTPIWEACHHLCRALKISETEAGSLLAKMPEKGETIRQLAYRLYTQCERKGWAEDARNYNELITSWPSILEESRKAGHSGTQMEMFE